MVWVLLLHDEVMVHLEIFHVVPELMYRLMHICLVGGTTALGHWRIFGITFLLAFLLVKE